MVGWLLGMMLGCADTVYQPTPDPPTPTPEKAPQPEGADRCETFSPIFPSHGVHNPCRCPDDECDAVRGPDDPTDPQYPAHWVARWTMYRVFAPQPDNPPPYADPPAGLTEADYEASSGVTYYDSAYVPADKDGVGAMLERYDKRCLPIFPSPNDYSCTFASLGNKTWMLTDEADRPAGMPACCLFSPYHHAPQRDFIRHLPYSAEDSARLDGTIQAYRYTVTREGDDIWFGYAFHRDQPLDAEGTQLRPQSFYFSGAANDPPVAPIVSQNYGSFTVEVPDAAIWAPVVQACSGEAVPMCGLFDADPARFSSAPETLEGLIGSGWDDLHGGPQRPPLPPPTDPTAP